MMDPERELRARKKLEKYHDVIEKKLKVSLARIMEQRDRIYTQQSEYVQLRNNIAVLQESKQKKMESLVNLGSEFYAQAVVPDTSRIFVEVGLTLRVEFTLDEAVDFCKRKEAHLKTKGDMLTRKASELKANIKLIYDAMAEIMRLDREEKDNRKR
mmetsp:Transcript_15125/g.29735  ORF Transcript_15125/g.29735 Transcript_15125/m.29735 type:complete len:156 (-) Transcript_15125:235-702(-)